MSEAVQNALRSAGFRDYTGDGVIGPDDILLRLMDDNNDGIITPEERRRGTQRQNGVYEGTDYDGDGVVERSEVRKDLFAADIALGKARQGANAVDAALADILREGGTISNEDQAILDTFRSQDGIENQPDQRDRWNLYKAGALIAYSNAAPDANYNKKGDDNDDSKK